MVDNVWHDFRAAARLETPSRVPVALLGTGRFYASARGLRLFECTHDPCRMIEAELETVRRLPGAMFMPYPFPDYGAGVLSAFGCEVKWFEDRPPEVVRPVLFGPEDIDSLPKPDPWEDGHLPWYLQSLGMFRRYVDPGEDSGRPTFLWTLGPGELGGRLMGIDNLLYSVKAEPQLVGRLFEKLCGFITDWLEAQLEVLGRAEGFLLTDDIAGMVSPATYRDVFAPFHAEIRRRFPDLVMVFHCDTRAEHIVGEVAAVGADVFQAGPDTGLAASKERARARGGMCIMGNIDCVRVLQQGTVDQVRDDARRCLAEAKEGGGFVLSGSGGLNEGTSLEKIEALVEVAAAEGAYA